MTFSLEDLKQRAREKEKEQKRIFKQRYDLARKLGFTPYESTILGHKRSVDIEQLAKER